MASENLPKIARLRFKRVQRKKIIATLATLPELAFKTQWSIAAAKALLSKRWKPAGAQE